jgi:hypothetical protein
MSDPAHPGDMAPPAIGRMVLRWCAALVALWLCSPVLWSQHVEAYTTSLLSIATAANRGDPMAADYLMPVVTEFLYFTRPGMIGLFELTGRLFGGPDDLHFRAVMLASFAVLVAASVCIARREGRITWPFALAAVLLVSSATEICSFFNDNAPSTALAVAAMAVASWRDKTWSYAPAGALLAAAMLCRLDALLLAPAIAGIAWTRHPRLAPIAWRGLAALLGALAVFALAAVWLKATPLDASLAARGFYPALPASTRVKVMLMAIGLPGLLLVGIGTVAAWRRSSQEDRRWAWRATFIGVPLLIVAAGLLTSGEVRYIYPLLTPFVAMHGGRAFELLMTALSGPRRRAAVAMLAAIGVLAAVPPVRIEVREGPHSTVGRLWMPALWWRWQSDVHDNFRRVDGLVAQIGKAPRTLVISTYFNDDFYLKQRLIEAGYRILPSQPLLGCKGIAVYDDGRHLVAHIRAWNHYSLAGTSQSALTAAMIDNGLSCPALARFGQAFLTIYGSDLRFAPDWYINSAIFRVLLPRMGDLTRMSTAYTTSGVASLHPFRRLYADPTLAQRARLGIVTVYPLSGSDLAALKAAAAAYRISPARAPDDLPITTDQFLFRYAARCVDPVKATLRDLPACATAQDPRRKSGWRL